MNPKQGQQPEEEMVSCPFNPSHRFRKSKLIFHITKCKDPSRDLYLHCNFNSTHWYKKEDMAEHRETCPDKNNIAEGIVPDPNYKSKETCNLQCEKWE